MVDGINLDEIKELRRLSLGLTQTQVGQALSVTEGPAYSQSAICRWVHILQTTASHISHITPVQFLAFFVVRYAFFLSSFLQLSFL